MVNDVVADSAGNVYLTNSYGDFIWKVTMEGIASVFAKSSIFLSQLVVVNSSVAWWGSNGLAYHTEGAYLLVLQSYSGAMFKVDLESAKVEVVNLKNPLTSVDGIALQFNGGGLVAVSPQKAWLLLESKNNWESAAVIDINPFDPSDSIAAVTIQDQYQMHVLPFFVFDLVNGEKAHREEFIPREIEFSKEDSEDDTLWLGLTLQVFFIVVVLAWRIQNPK